MNVYALSAFIGVFTNLFLGLYVYFQNRKSTVNITWFLLSISVAGWSLGYGITLSGLFSREIILLSIRFANASAAMIVAFFLHFVFAILELANERKPIIQFNYALATLISLSNLTHLAIPDVVVKLNFLYYPKAGLLYYFFTLYFLVSVVYLHIIFFKKYKELSGAKRNQIKYLLVGSIFGFGGGLTTFPLVFDIEMLPFGSPLVSFYPIIITYAIIRYRLMDITVAISRAGIFLFVYTLILGIPFWVGHQTGSWLFTAISMFLLASIGPLNYRYLQKKAENLLLAQQRRYHKILLQAAGGMLREHSLQRLLKLIVYMVRKTVRVTFAAAFFRDKDRRIYRLKAVRDGRGLLEDLLYPSDSLLVTYLKRVGEPVITEELPVYVRDALYCPLPIGLIVPSFVKSQLQGFLFLGEKLNRKPYSQDDINIFRILSRQAALAIENCLFFEEFKKAQSKIFEAEKLASIGGMADGVAHQIKNRLNHFSVAGREMQSVIEYSRRKHSALLASNPALKESLDYLYRLGDSLVENVKRTDSVVKGILNYALVEEKGRFFGYFSLGEIIDIAKGLLRVKHQIETLPLEERISIDTIWGVKSQIMEALYNLLDNAYEATQELSQHHLTPQQRQDYQPKIILEAKDNRSLYFISICDNGIGIRGEDQHRVFAPFFTTKPSATSGSGIGMYVVKRIIEENHKGRVWFESVYKRGTTFYIELPKKSD